MTRLEKPANFSRRALLKAGGALVVSIGAPVTFDFAQAEDAAGPAAMSVAVKPALTPDQLSSYIAVNADGTIAAYFGKMDMGHGIAVAIAQMVAEELDAPFGSVKMSMGDTATSVNQGGASGSTGIEEGGKQMRLAAAEARRVLVEMAADKLGAPSDQLTVRDAVVYVKADPAKKVAYAELVGGRYFNVPLAWNGKIGNPLLAPGKAKPKDPKDHRVVGQPIKREDVAPRVFAQLDFITDVKVPGMVHGRMIRPQVAGAAPVKIDETSIKDIPGAKVVWKEGFLGVVADKEWDAIKAMRQLKVEWSDVKPPFPEKTSAIYDYIRNAPVRKKEAEGKNVGDVEAAFKTAARVIEAEYEWPFQSHASMGPACAVVEVKDDRATVWTGSQKPHFTRDGVAAIIGMKPEQVHGIWIPGPGCYGRNDAGDAAMDAALLAKAVGKPVRLQYMRDQATGWDPKGPASIHRARAAIDASGKVIAYEFMSRGLPRVDVNSNESQPYDTLAGQLTGVALKSGDGFAVPQRILRLRQQIHVLGNGAAAARPRLAAAHLASARSGRPANPLRKRILHGRSGGGIEHGSGRVPSAICARPARYRRDQGGGGESQLAIAAVAAQGPERQQGLRPGLRLRAARPDARRHRRRSRYRPHHRKDLGAQIHRCA